MKDAQSLRSEFEKAKEDASSNWNVKNVTAVLDVMRNTVQGLADGGFSASLEVNMAGFESSPYARGEFIIDGVKLGFVLTRDHNSYYPVSLHLGIGDHDVAKLETSPDNQENLDSLAKGLRAALFRAKALSEMYAEYSVNPNGISRLPAAKPGAPKLNA